MFFKRKKKPVGTAANMAPAVSAEPSYIGRDTTVEGQLSCEGELHVDGTVRGSVRAQVCVIDVDGVVQGDVSGEVIHVRGRVHGPIQGNSVFIHNGAHVEGDVFHDTISIENGAYVYGSIRHNGAASIAQTQTRPTLFPNLAPGEGGYDEDPSNGRS